ncbi:MAG: Stp1/IreP family PP2C-type Ser/Thr phosphatase [Deltaproteobacteria bacterium]|nr:Stp1/IreP family PP2C-type Ser/Thr phosphatase [Deltaproteobacteria bacterium]
MGLADGIRFFAATDVGRVRDHNEDNYLVDKKLALFIVADGMGGHAAGEVASALAVRTVHEEIRKQRQLIEDFETGATGASAVSARDVLNLLEYSVQRACARIHEEAVADAQKRGMGTTLSSMLFVGNKGFIAHVGDSRIYLQRDGRIQQVTEDHTVFNELIKRGKLSREQIEKVAHKNAITRAVGVYERVEVDTLALEVLPGDLFILCSDGLHGYLDGNDALARILRDVSPDLQAQALIDHANESGGKDNVTTILVRVEGSEADKARARRLAQKREILAKMQLFSRLTERELLRVMQAAEIREYRAGDVIMREGDKGDELFIVLSGKVAVVRGEATLAHLGPGEHVGEMALIRAVPRSASVMAEVPSEMVVIKRSDFFEILRREHELAIKFLWQFLGVLADRLDATSRDLRTAREEAQIEDITDEIFPEVEAASATDPRRRA